MNQGLTLALSNGIQNPYDMLFYWLVHRNPYTGASNQVLVSSQMQIMTSPAFREKHPLYTGKWHGHSQRSFLSWFRREEGWSVRGHHQPAQPCKVAGNPLDAMAPSTSAAPVPLMMALPFQSMTAALMKNVFWPLSAKALMAFTAPGPPLSWRTATLLHQSWPLLVQENEPWKQRITCDELSNSQKASNFEKVSRFIHEVRSEIQWYFFLSIFFRMSSGERRLNHGWSANSLSSCQLRRRFCPGHDVIAQMLSGRMGHLTAHSSTLGCWVPVQKICLQLLDPH